MLWGRALGGLGALGLTGAVAGQLWVITSMRCIDAGCMAAGAVSMLSAAAALLAIIIGGIGFGLLQSSGFGFAIDWKRPRTWLVLLAAVLLIPGMWLWPYLAYFLAEGPTSLWLLRGLAGLGVALLVRTVARNAKAGKRTVAALGLPLCAMLLLLSGVMTLETRKCVPTMLTYAQYLCWGADFNGKPVWHGYVAAYHLAGG